MKVLLGFAVFTITASAVPCCGVAGAGKQVHFAGQTNIVIWDAATKTEHFVRDAKFESNAKDFGFIAPSPSTPELAEVDRKAFDLLAALQPIPPHSEAAVAAADKAEAPRVEVLQSVDVAGYHATTLRANDSAALAAWLRKNGYQATRGTEAWLKPYVAKKWVLTAFKVLNPRDLASTGTVRMSFHTERPFNPFLVPAENLRQGNPSLQLFFVAAHPVEGSLAGVPWVNANWQASLPSEKREALAAMLKLPVKAIPANAQVTTFETQFSADATDDVFFEEKSSPVVYVVSGFAVLALAGGAWALLRRRPPTSSQG